MPAMIAPTARRRTVGAWPHLLTLAALITAAPARADDHADVGRLMREGKLGEAHARVDRYLQTRPADARMRLYKGVLQRESGNLADAIATFSKLGEDHPELPEPHNNLAVIYAAQGQHDKARLALEKALRTNPAYATAHNNLSDIYAMLSSQAYSKALQINNGVAAPARLTMIQDLSTTAGGRPVLAMSKPTPTPTSAPAPTAASQAAPALPPPPAAPVSPAASRPAPVTAAPPVAPAVKPAPPPAVVQAPAAVPATDSKPAVEQAVRAWARAWADKNMAQYLAAYSKDFRTPGNVDRAHWEQDRHLRITGKSRITVNVLELQITVNGERAVAKFRQDYRADALAILSRKTLELVKTGDRWLIVSESTGG